MTFMVKPNTGMSDIADQLERRGLISDARVFRSRVTAYGNDGSLKAGEYEIKAGASMHDIMELLKSGKSMLYSLTIPEGLTVAQAWQRDRGKRGADRRHAGDDAAEGSLAADTQRFTRGGPRPADHRQDAGRPEEAGRDIWERACRAAARQIDEFVTLASIVEKETGVVTSARAWRPSSSTG